MLLSANAVSKSEARQNRTLPVQHAGLGTATAAICSGLDKVSCAAGQATELRLAGNAEARGGDLPRAVELYSQVSALSLDDNSFSIIAAELSTAYRQVAG